MAFAFGHGAFAQDSIQFVDGGDLQLLEPVPPAKTWKGLEKDTAPPNTALNPSPDGRMIRIQPTADGGSVGVDIKLDESDQIELREASRFSFRTDVGTVSDFAAGVTAGPYAPAARSAMTTQGLDGRTLLGRAAAVNPDRALATALLRDPGVLEPRYAGLRIGYATGYSADDPLGFNPASRGFEIYLTSTIMSRAFEPDTLSYLDASRLSLTDTSYNVGLNVGYRGFTFAASYLHGGNRDTLGYNSYDMGLSYNFGSLITSIAVGGYFVDRNPISLVNALDVDQLYSLEIGAAYQLRPGITLLGRFKLFDSRTLLRGTSLDGLGGSFYLGTSFGF
ncbi:MAG: hypothetical protein GC201_07545 [Alphaproteobacteria bacterium]|nr:hypothetical protein [Alphaproteobacteria bacterium]